MLLILVLSVARISAGIFERLDGPSGKSDADDRIGRAMEEPQRHVRDSFRVFRSPRLGAVGRADKNRGGKAIWERDDRR